MLSMPIAAFDAPELAICNHPLAPINEAKGKKRTIDETKSPCVVKLTDLCVPDRADAIVEFANQFATAWLAAVADDHWCDPNCSELSTDDSVCTVTVPIAGTVKLDVYSNDEFHLTCEPRFSPPNGSLPRVAVRMYGSLDDTFSVIEVPIDAAKKATSGKMKVVKIKTGRGGYAQFAVPAGYVADE
jgi:hypothetical protein